MDRELIREILLGYLMERGTDEHAASTFHAEGGWYGRYNGTYGGRGGLLTTLSRHGYTLRRNDIRESYWSITQAGLDFLKGNSEDKN